MTPITADEALRQTSDDPTAYNLPADAGSDQVDAKRQEAAQRLMAGVAANDAYWDSRGQLEQLMARASGHGVVQRGDTPPDQAAVGGAADAPVIEGTSEPDTPTALSEAPVPSPDNPNEAIAKLREQVTSLGGTPSV